MKHLTLRTTWCVFLFTLFATAALSPKIAFAQRVVDVCPEAADSLAMNPAIRGGPEQIAEIRVTLSYTYAQGDTTHASPAEAAHLSFAFMDSTGAIVVRSGNCNVLDIPNSVMPGVDKIKGRAFMDALRDALKYYVGDFDD